MDSFTQKKGTLVVISGYSGVGKGTVIKKMMSDHPEYAFSVSATTRSPRPGEVDGREYFFISRECFDQWVEEGRFLEHTRYQDRCYGTLKDYVLSRLKEGISIILDIEIEGALNVKKALPEARLFYIIPPSAEELKKRLSGRGTETPEQITGRLRRAVEETAVIPQYDYVLINDEVEACAAQLHRLSQEGGEPAVERQTALALAEEIRKDLQEILQAD